ncbi:MAG: hypothetical protein GY814_17625, partial [Gammaproteobacteria bacterium]|nr:hypothetical protein [Gammaproteobacteria bacterium]
MDTKYIGTDQDFETIEEWADYIRFDTITEPHKGILTDDKAYPIVDASALWFFGHAWEQGITLTSDTSVRYDGDFGNGARIDVDFQLDISGFNLEWVSIDAPYSVAMKSTYFDSVACNLTGNAAIRVTGGNTILRAVRVHAPLATGFSLEHATAELYACTAEGCLVGVNAHATNTATIQNVVTHNCGTGWTGIYSGTYSNNASDDGTHPGLDGVLVTADPYEADGYTPSQGGQLTNMGIDVGVTHGADGKPFALVPAIGAYPAYLPDDSVSPILTNPTSEGDTVGLVCKVDTDEATGILF